MHSVPALRDPTLLIQSGFINGKATFARSGEFFDVFDPATGNLVGKCTDFDQQDALAAVDAAAVAFESFRKTLARERARILRKWYNLMVENAEDLATLITWENGKPLPDAKGEAAFASNFLEWFSEEAVRVYGDVIPSSNAGTRLLALKQPIGVCAMITPWNFPAAMLTRKAGAAIAAGCTVVIKPASETPFTASALVELAHRAGVPPGVINIIHSKKNTVKVGELLTNDLRIKKLSFTGSTRVGKWLMQQSSQSLKKLSLELGGNAPFIIFDDCPDIDAAIMGAINCKFRSSGQTCICANRIYVHETIYNEFAQKLVQCVQNFSVGHGFHSNTTHGPLIHERAVAKVDDQVRDAQRKGAQVLIGGDRLPALGPNFYAPTVLAGVTSEMLISKEETFGPVAALIPFSTEKQVVEMANTAEVGLAGYLFSRDIARVYRVVEAIETGMMGVNTGLISDVASPFGGIKESGFGREGSKYGIDEYLVTKSFTIGGIQNELQG